MMLVTSGTNGSRNCYHEKHERTFATNLVSTVCLILIALLGIFGNILVLLVYCFNQRRRFNHFPAKRLKTPTNQPSATFSTQRYLIISLAAVDLLTCLVILPWDIYKSIQRTINHDLENDKDDFSKFFSQLFTGLRNIAFACEGSILAGIALDRFLTVVFSAPISDAKSTLEQSSLRDRIISFLGCDQNQSEYNTKTCFCCYRSQIKTNMLACSCGLLKCKDVQSSLSMNYKFIHDCLCCGLYVSTDGDVHKRLQKERKEENIKRINNSWCERFGLLLKSKCLEMRSYMVWGSIALISVAVAAVECSIFGLEYYKKNGNSGCDAEKLKETAFTVYMFAALLSGLLIFFMYYRVFITAHRQEVKNKSLKNHNINSHRPNTLMTITNEEVNVIRDQPKLNMEESSSRAQEISTQDNQKNNRTTHLNTLSERRNRMRTQRQIWFRFRQFWQDLRKPAVVRSRRTGLMLFISTVVFYATLLPVFLNHGLKNTFIEFIHHEFYYINNAINVVIYSGLNPSFRIRLKNLNEAFMLRN